ncbi:MAG: YgjV family protein [Bacilli bacterium]|nr:YgjV family protein [Bacilli bacterium]
MNFILSQIFVLLGIVFIILSLWSRDKQKILIFCLISSVMFALQYFFLNALEGVVINALGILRAIWFFIYDKKEKPIPLYPLIILIVLFAIATIFTYESIFCLAPFIAASVLTYSVWDHRVLIYKFCAIPISICWIIYNVYVGSVFGYISDSVLLIIEISALIEYIIRMNRYKKLHK